MLTVWQLVGEKVASPGIQSITGAGLICGPVPATALLVSPGILISPLPENHDGSVLGMLAASRVGAPSNHTARRTEIAHYKRNVTGGGLKRLRLLCIASSSSCGITFFYFV